MSSFSQIMDTQRILPIIQSDDMYCAGNKNEITI